MYPGTTANVRCLWLRSKVVSLQCYVFFFVSVLMFFHLFFLSSEWSLSLSPTGHRARDQIHSSLPASPRRAAVPPHQPAAADLQGSVRPRSASARSPSPPSPCRSGWRSRGSLHSGRRGSSRWICTPRNHGSCRACTRGACASGIISHRPW